MLIMLQAGFMELRAKQAVDWVGQQARTRLLVPILLPFSATHPAWGCVVQHARARKALLRHLPIVFEARRSFIGIVLHVQRLVRVQI